MFFNLSYVKTFFSFSNRDDENYDNNLRVGLLVVVFFFLVISVLAFPNGKLYYCS